MKNLKFLITGTGKCGTVYLANLLTAWGIPCGHEAIFTNQGLEEAIERLKSPRKIKFSGCADKLPKWTNPTEILADSSYMATPFLEEKILKNTKIIYLIRNPIKVINSFVTGDYFDKHWPEITVPFQNFIKQHLPNLYDNDLNKINRAALFYLKWNELIENKIQNKNHIIHKIEDCDENLLDFLEIKQINKVNINKKINSWANKNIINIKNIESEIQKKLFEFSIKHGYNYKKFI